MNTQDVQTADRAQPVASVMSSWPRLLGYVGLVLLSLLMTASFLRPDQCPTPSEEDEKKVKVSTTVYQVSYKPPLFIGQDSSSRLPSAETDNVNYLWMVRHWFFGSDLPLDAAGCQEWMAFLQSDATFFALRHPAESLPLFPGAPFTPTLALQDAREWPHETLLQVPLALRPERQAFVESQLPSAPGQQWLALGLADTPAADCSGLPSLAGNEWQFLMSYYLDLGGGPLDGEGEVLSMYYCHEGQSAPPFFQALLSRPLAGDAMPASGQRQGITCIGPQPVLLTARGTPPDFDLHSTYVAHITPTEGITLPHWLANWGSAPLTVSLTHTSTLNTSWSIVSGTAEGPQVPLVPITSPITLSAFSDIRYIWLLAQAPADTEAGAYTLIITATDVTSPAVQVWTSDLLWVGEWVAPPLDSDHRVYLPLVLRQGLAR